MTAVASTTVAREHAQLDGSFWVTETQALDDGTAQVFTYLAPAGTDIAAVAAARVPAINAQLSAVPQSCTQLQARRALDAAGLRVSVETAVSAADTATQEMWYTNATVERDNPLLLAVAAQIGLTSAQIDDLFRQAVRM